MDYAADEVIIASGSRPLIYAAYRAIVDPGERVVYPVPSWNNENYAALTEAKISRVPTVAAHGFMPTADALAPHLSDAVLLALCSPQNPTGTLFTEQNLRAICDLVVAENRRRTRAQKPLYVMFDQVYWALSFGYDDDGYGNRNTDDIKNTGDESTVTPFHHPLALCPEIADYAIFIDGISKAFAATGVRVGWATGPRELTAKMSALITHIGAWAPRPEQVGAGVFLADHAAVDRHLTEFRAQLKARLAGFHNAFIALKNEGHPVDAIAPQAAIYLSIKIDIQNKKNRHRRIIKHPRRSAKIFIRRSQNRHPPIRLVRRKKPKQLVPLISRNLPRKRNPNHNEKPKSGVESVAITPP